MAYTAQKIAPNQILTDAPLDAAREAAWQAFAANRLQQVTIDTNNNVVGGFQPANLLTNGQRVHARFESRPEGTVITVNSGPIIGGGMDFRKAKKPSRNFTDKIFDVLQAGWQRSAFEVAPSVAPSQETLVSNAPIAAPTGEVAPILPSGSGIYGPLGPVPQGKLILTYGIFGLCCCQLAAPFTIYYGFKALQEYGTNDPGDKSMVIIGMVLGGLGCIVFVLNILTRIVNMAGVGNF